MAPKLRISVSKDTAYPPTHPIEINTTTPTRIQTGSFEGDVRVWIKGYNGDEEDGKEYFDHVHERGEKRNLTYAISLRGRFNDDVNGDDLLFGNVFERPIKNNLPWGTSVAMKFTHYIDPTLEHDVYADKPWAMSPVLGCMSVLTLSETHAEEAQQVVMHEQSAKYLQSQDDEFEHEQGVEDRLERQKWFSSVERREKVVIKKGMEVGMEFSNGFLDFNTLSLNLPYPISMQIPLLSYWDGQPVIYVCRKRSQPGTSPVDPEGMFFSIGFEIVDEEAIEKLEGKGGEILWLSDIGKEGKEGKGEVESDEEGSEEEEEVNDDVD